MRLPFVSRARFEELQAAHKELRETHERMLDYVYFVSSGQHLYDRFDKPREVVTVAPDNARPPIPLSPMEEAVAAGGPLSAQRRRMEQVSLSDMRAKEFRVSEQLEAERQKELAARAADLLNQALVAGEQKAKQQQPS